MPDTSDTTVMLKSIYEAGVNIITFESKKLYAAIFGGIAVNNLRNKKNEEQFSFEDYLAAPEEEKKADGFGQDLDSRKASDNIDDLQIAAYLINPLKNDWSIDSAAKQFNGSLISSYEQVFSKRSVEEAAADKEAFGKFAAAEVMQLSALKTELMKELLK